jgi:N-acetylglucosaminyldiphosphoundecaprenol N-acetyl-beta-D-mannosaminyltransferase
LNPHSVVVAQADKQFEQALNASTLLLPDGAGIVLAAKVLGKEIGGRVAGTEFFLEISRKLNDSGGARYYFLGSSDDVLKKIKDRLENEFPDIAVVGTYSPPFRSEFSDIENQDMIAAVNVAKPDVLWVGMTAPKQEKWMWQHREQLDVPLTVAIGAVFDFYAGTKQRAPDWVCRLGLEWLPRLLREPKRLWRRNFVSTPLFLYGVLKHRLVGRGL